MRAGTRAPRASDTIGLPTAGPRRASGAVWKAPVMGAPRVVSPAVDNPRTLGVRATDPPRVARAPPGASHRDGNAVVDHDS
jgi:hypothetical protein